MLKITGTFLDEISHDIPHQNWGEKEWDKDFRAMKAMGIQKVFMIRCGYKRFCTYPSAVLEKIQGAYRPPLDLVDLFLRLADKYGMDFFFGTYDSGVPWYRPEVPYDVEKEVDVMRRVVDEAWERYGNYPAFKGWYLSQEIGRRNANAQACYKKLGEHCKAFSPDLKIFISPGMLGPKAYNADMQKLGKTIPLRDHEEEWNEIMEQIHSFVDIIAFQDGHLNFEDLPDFLSVNKKLCDRYGIECWTNCESFDRDMPINFLPIKWEKMLLKLTYAAQAGVKDAITFEFSHFMSPNSSYHSAHHLYDRYCEYYGLPARADDFAPWKD